MIDSNEELIKKGQILPLMEDFYSIQGEGFHAGKAAYFIRLGGCDIGCSWCDEKASWNANFHPLVPTEKIIDNVLAHPAKVIVVTGGEPSMYNLDLLTSLAQKNNIATFIETSGTNPLSGTWNWICLSPKKQAPPIDEFYSRANELKVIIEKEEDLIWAEFNAAKLTGNTHLYLQPEWSRVEELIPMVVNYAKNNPQWSISLQAHKYMHIP